MIIGLEDGLREDFLGQLNDCVASLESPAPAVDTSMTRLDVVYVSELEPYILTCCAGKSCSLNY